MMFRLEQLHEIHLSLPFPRRFPLFNSSSREDQIVIQGFLNCYEKRERRERETRKAQLQTLQYIMHLAYEY